MAHAVTAGELPDGHVPLDIGCLDRICLPGFVNSLQTPGGVVCFLHDHRGFPVASPAVFAQIGDQCRRAVSSYAEASDIPLARLKAAGRNADVMRPCLGKAAAGGRSGWPRSGWRRTRRSCGPPGSAPPARESRPGSRSPRRTAG